MIDINGKTIEELIDIERAINKQIRNLLNAEAKNDTNVYAVRKSWVYGGGIRNSHLTADIGWGNWMDNDLTHSGLHLYSKREAEMLVEIYKDNDIRKKKTRYTYSIVALDKNSEVVKRNSSESYKNIS